ncbi:hypothetical protein CJ468_06498 [Nocardia farcinica]|nr:hypothetical protein CJ468_06498 [Nocardia farcinica]
MTKRSFFRYFPTKEDVVFDGIDFTGESASLTRLRHSVLRWWSRPASAGVASIRRMVARACSLA